MTQVFLLSVFIICFRESIEAAVIISVLLSFIKQSFGGPDMDKKLYHRLCWQVWLGSLAGLVCCLIIGGAFIGAFYSLGKDIWSNSEDLWEGVFAVIACVMITVMGFGMLRLNKMKSKWRLKIAKAILEDEDEADQAATKKTFVQKMRGYNPLGFRFSKFGRWTRKYAMFLLPFITVLREGIEAIVFVGGVGVGEPAKAFPLSVIIGLICGGLFGFALYKFGSLMSLRLFLIFSTCLLYLIAAGLFSRSVWYFEMNEFSKKTGGDVAEQGSGPGSYNIKTSVWHVNCCNPELNSNGWGVFNGLFGWQNSATYGSVISYNVYWIFIMFCVVCMWYMERTGGLPIIGKFYKKKQLSQAEEAALYERAQNVALRKYGKDNTAAASGSSDSISVPSVEANSLEKGVQTKEKSLTN